MAAKKNGLGNFLKKVIAAREKTNDKLATLAIESGKNFSRTSADLNGLTLGKFVDNYHAELDACIELQTKPAQGSFRARREIKYGDFQIFDVIKYNVNRGYFQFGEESFKIHWVRRGSPIIKGLALDMEDVVWTIRYGSGEDETLSPVFCILPSMIHALYKTTTTDRRRVFALWNEIWEYVGNAIKTTLDVLIRRPQATMSERFQFDGASFVVTVTSLNVGGKCRTDLYMTVAKDAEYENLLSRENVRQLAESVSKSDAVSEKTLEISRADFVKGCNAALLESAHAQDRKPLNYYDRFILDDNAVEELDAEGGRVVYFKLGEKTVKLGCFERENSLAAIFYSSELELRDDRNIDSDPILMLSAVRSFYKGVDLKKISNHLREILTATKEIIHVQLEDMKRETEQSVVSTRTFERTSAKEFRFGGEIFFVKVTTVYDNVSKFMKVISSFTVTRDAALENVFDKPSESVALNAGLGITREEFLDNYGAFIDEHATDKANNPFRIVGERTDEFGDSYLQLNDGDCRIYLTVGERNLERLTYRSLSLSGWKEIFLALSSAVIKGRLNAVEDFSKFYQESAEVIEKEMRDTLSRFEAEVKANTPTEPIERELFARTFSISGLVFEFVFNVLADPTSRENPLMVGLELTIKRFS